MSSSAASSCICSPKASSASATLASSLTAGAPPSCHFACNYSAQYHRRRKPPPFSKPALGSALNAVAQWFSSRDLLPPSCSSVRHLLSPEPPHETTIPTSLTRGLPASCRRRAPFFYLRSPLPFPPRLKLLLPPHTNFHQPILPSICPPSLPVQEAFSITPRPLNRHNCLSTGRLPSNGCIESAPFAASDSRRSLWGANPIQH